jgi:hypothetical protein
MPQICPDCTHSTYQKHGGQIYQINHNSFQQDYFTTKIYFQVFHMHSLSSLLLQVHIPIYD